MKEVSCTAMRPNRLSLARNVWLCIPLVLLVLRPCAGRCSAGLADKSFDRVEVQRTLQRFLTGEREFIQRGLSNAPAYLSIAENAFDRRGLPEELIYRPIIESGFSVKAYSRAGAAGIWQFMPSTGRIYGLRIDYWVDERRDPFKSTEKAAAHLSDLYDWYDDWDLALAAYNAGRNGVDKAIKKGKTKDYWKLCSLGLLKRETREYVPRFYAACHIAKNFETYGFTFAREGGFPEYEVLAAEKTVDLTLLGEKAGISLGSLQFLNPELKKVITPYGEKYKLRVPKASYARALAAYHELPKEVFKNVRRHQVRSGETLGEIADRYGTDLYLLKKINSIAADRRLRAGDRILVPIPEHGPASEEEMLFDAKKDFKTQEIGYTVKRGDTVWSIARKYNTDVERILTANGLSFDSVIKPGDEITLWLDISLMP